MSILTQSTTNIMEIWPIHTSFIQSKSLLFLLEFQNTILTIFNSKISKIPNVQLIMSGPAGGHRNRYEGGPCYAACMETFTFYNPSIKHCWRGCDYGVGRVNDENQRKVAWGMCKRYTTELYSTDLGQLDNINDLRVHSEMFPTTPPNVYRACLAGVRRQKY